MISAPRSTTCLPHASYRRSVRVAAFVKSRHPPAAHRTVESGRELPEPEGPHLEIENWRPSERDRSRGDDGRKTAIQHPRSETDIRLSAPFQSIPVPSNSHERTAAIRTPFQLSERRQCWRQRSQTSIAGSKAAIPSGTSRKTDVPQSAPTLSPGGETLKRRTVLLGDGQPAAAGDRTANIGGRARRAPPAARPQSDAGETRPQQDGDGASTFF